MFFGTGQFSFAVVVKWMDDLLSTIMKVEMNQNEAIAQISYIPRYQAIIMTIEDITWYLCSCIIFANFAFLLEWREYCISDSLH